MKTIDTNGVALATVPVRMLPVGPTKAEAETYPKPVFVDPELKNAALRAIDARNGKATTAAKPTKAPEGRLY